MVDRSDVQRLRRMRPGRATCDGIPHELFRAGGFPAASLYGQQAATVSSTSVQSGMPLAWRGGRVAVAPRKKHAPLAADNILVFWLLQRHLQLIQEPCED